MMCKEEDGNYVAVDTCETTNYTLRLHKRWERLGLEDSFASWSLESNFVMCSSLILFSVCDTRWKWVW